MGEVSREELESKLLTDKQMRALYRDLKARTQPTRWAKIDALNFLPLDKETTGEPLEPLLTKPPRTKHRTSYSYLDGKVVLLGRGKGEDMSHAIAMIHDGDTRTEYFFTPDFHVHQVTIVGSTDGRIASVDELGEGREDVFRLRFLYEDDRVVRIDEQLGEHERTYFAEYPEPGSVTITDDSERNVYSGPYQDVRLDEGS